MTNAIPEDRNNEVGRAKGAMAGRSYHYGKARSVNPGLVSGQRLHMNPHLKCHSSILVIGLPDHSRFAAAGVLEVLQLATELDGSSMEEPQWMSLSSSPDVSNWEGPVQSINKHTIIVVGGLLPSKWRNASFENWLRRHAAGGARLGAIGSATHIFAEAGLLDNHKVALHWDALAGFQERHTKLNANQNLYSIDDKRFSCAGGSAVLDMMITLVAGWFGGRIANQVASRILHGNVRPPDMDLPMMSGVTHTLSRKLNSLIRLMESNIENILSIKELASKSGVSPRQAQRLFIDHFDVSPMNHYRKIRLAHARRLLRQTDLSITEISFASGFSNSSHFSRCFKEKFGATPQTDRQSHHWFIM